MESPRHFQKKPALSLKWPPQDLQEALDLWDCKVAVPSPRDVVAILKPVKSTVADGNKATCRSPEWPQRSEPPTSVLRGWEPGMRMRACPVPIIHSTRGQGGASDTSLSPAQEIQGRRNGR